MRKLTGYIGALIIVFALMGSILAGYALNINGNTAIVNDYERVTDVSGLYTHSQEPSYIDYNPASNYIGYNVKQSETFTVNNNSSLAGGLSYKLFKGTAPSCSWNNNQYSSGAFYVNGAVVNYSTSGDQIGLNNYRVIVGETITAYVWQPDGTFATCEIQINGGRYWSANFNITYSDNTITVKLIDNNNTELTTACKWVLLPNNNGDYVPILNGNTGYYQYNNFYSTQLFPTSNVSVVNEWDNQPVYNMYSVYNSGSVEWAMVPKTFNYQPTPDTGINYTESSRVNNYPIETDYDTTTTTTPASMDLMAVSVANQFKGSNLNISISTVDSPRGAVTGFFYVNHVYSYKLSDLLPTMSIPANTTAIKFDCPTNLYTTNGFYQIDGYNIAFPTYFLDNYAVISGPDTGINRDPWLDNYGFRFDLEAKHYVMYYPDTQICDLFSSSGVKIGTYDGPDKIFITFVTNTTNEFPFKVKGYNLDENSTYSIPARNKPYMNILYTTTGTVSNVHYSDITKGYSIKNDNTSGVIWNNEYDNGNIQLLFRADDTNGTYHNDLTVGDNAISIDYSNGSFSVNLNNAGAVNVGKWRSIILDVDLTIGELAAIPVRTFNSYTNVVMDTASIVIGDMINPEPTNIIEWAPTTNSFMFNVYSTSVFMDTYGIVMVNPELNITDYFTDLNGFYRMRLYNFSILGSSITVNGVTANVNNNSITINEQTVQVKDMAITYADGHAYISDSNVNIDLGEVVDYDVSMTGAWYFETELLRGITSQKIVYTWDWGDFILNNTQFCVMYIGIALIGLIIARRYCSLSITDYIVLIASFAIALTVQVVA